MGFTPDWENLNKDDLRRYRVYGLLLIIIGSIFLSYFVSTIRLELKILSALLFGAGLHLFYNSHHRLKKGE